jgi:hypothetical protein
LKIFANLKNERNLQDFPKSIYMSKSKIKNVSHLGFCRQLGKWRQLSETGSSIKIGKDQPEI